MDVSDLISDGVNVSSRRRVCVASRIGHIHTVYVAWIGPSTPTARKPDARLTDSANRRPTSKQKPLSPRTLPDLSVWRGLAMYTIFNANSTINIDDCMVDAISNPGLNSTSTWLARLWSIVTEFVMLNIFCYCVLWNAAQSCILIFYSYDIFSYNSAKVTTCPTVDMVTHHER